MRILSGTSTRRVIPSAFAEHSFLGCLQRVEKGTGQEQTLHL